MNMSDYRKPDKRRLAAVFGHEIPDRVPNFEVLVDDLTPGPQNNPVWCTYGPCPNCSYLIGQDVVIVAVQTWAFVDAMKLAIDQLLQPQQDYPGTANAKAAGYGSSSLTGSGVFNELGLFLVPIGAVVLLRIRSRRR